MAIDIVETEPIIREIATVLLITTHDGEKKILLTKRSDNDPEFPGVWCPLTETKDDSDNGMVSTAARCLKEELGIENERINIEAQAEPKSIPMGSVTYKFQILSTEIPYTEEFTLENDDSQVAWFRLNDFNLDELNVSVNGEKQPLIKQIKLSIDYIKKLLGSEG